MKRILLVSTNSHFLATGGAAQFLLGLNKGFLEKNDWRVDLLLDQPPTNKEFIERCGFSGKIFYPEKPASYGSHRSFYSFADSINYEKEANFRDGLTQAFSNCLYDAILINSIEGFAPIILSGIQKVVPVYLYTHVEFSMGLMGTKNTPFYQQFIDYYTGLMKAFDEQYILVTQTLSNHNRIEETLGINAEVVPMYLPEAGLMSLMKSYDREGILFNGRYEPRKRPQEYIDLIKETGLPAKVMTSKKSTQKFEAKFKEAGISNYTIKTDIHGQEKIDYIKSCRFMYHPSLHENFSFSVLESMTSIPVLVDGDAPWHENFASKNFILQKSTKDNRKEIALNLYQDYNKDIDENYKSCMQYLEFINAGWSEVFSFHEIKPADKSNADFAKHDEFRYSDYIDGLGRKPSIEDFIANHRNRGCYKISQLKDGTYLSKTKYVEEFPAQGIENFFS